MSWGVKVAGVDKTDYVSRAEELVVDQLFNERDNVEVTFLPGFVPPMHALLTILADITDDATAEFGGVIIRREMINKEGNVFYKVECGDWCTYGDWADITADYTDLGVYPSGVSLFQVATDIVAALAGYGVTLSASQANPGPMLSNFKWDSKKVSDAAREVTERTGYIYNIDPATLEFLFSVPGAVEAGFSVSDATPNNQTLSWYEDDENFATRVKVGNSDDTITDLDQAGWTTTAGGTETEWWTPYPIEWYGFRIAWITKPAVPTYYTILGTGAAELNLEYDSWSDPVGGVAHYGARLYQHIGDAAYPAGTTIVFDFIVKLPLIVDNGGSPTVTLSADGAGITTMAALQEKALEALETVGTRTKKVTIDTITSGASPEQHIHVQDTVGGIPASLECLITEVKKTFDPDGIVKYEIYATEGLKYQGNELDYFRSLGGAGVALALGGGGGTSGGSKTVFPLGGSRTEPITADSYAYVANYIPFTSTFTGSARVRVHLWAVAASVGVTAELFNMTDDVALAPTSVKITKQEVVDLTDMTTFDVSVVEGKTYALKVLSDTAGALVYGQGTIQEL